MKNFFSDFFEDFWLKFIVGVFVLVIVFFIIGEVCFHPYILALVVGVIVVCPLIGHCLARWAE